MQDSCCENKSHKKSNSTNRKRRSAVLNCFSISENYKSIVFAKTFKEQFFGAAPFPHFQFKNFIENRNGDVEDLELELQEFGGWKRKENDLYSLYQTDDLKSVQAVSHPALYSFRQFFHESVKNWLETITDVQLTDQIDMNGSCYISTDGLLPHNDLIETRRFAFVYYLTPFQWNEAYGGELFLYQSNEREEPVKVSKKIPPARNSLLVFEVSKTSWHRVNELFANSDPRLSINGWFHSSRLLKPEVPPLTQTTTVAPLQDKDLKMKKYLSDVYLEQQKLDQVQKSFSETSEVSLRQFIKTGIYKKVLNDMLSIQFEKMGPLSKRLLYEYRVDDSDSSIRSITNLFRSCSFIEFLSTVTGCSLAEVSISISVLKLSHGCYSVIGDEDMIRSRKDGFVLESHFFLGKSEWPDGCGGNIVYIGNEDEEELISVLPIPNCISIVLREPEVASFIKYVNANVVKDDMYVITCRYYGVVIESDSEEDN